MSLKAENITIEVVQEEEVSIHLASNIKDAVYEVTRQCSHGAYALDPKSGHLQYRSDKNFVGTDRITYIAKREDEESIPGDVVIAVLDSKHVEKVIEITIEVPVKPTADDIVEACADLIGALKDITDPDDEDDDD